MDDETLDAPSRVFGARAPQSLRVFVRTREVGLFLVALGIGAIGGGLVAALGLAAQTMHEFLFALPRAAHLSIAPIAAHWRIIAATTVGGLALAALTAMLGPRLRGRTADVIEANALHGGRMSGTGSLFIAAQTLISNGFGLSVGLEAAYAQLGGATGSLAGQTFSARRADLRLFVACGAAAAIGGAFGAPFTGAFYAFETVLGLYTVGALAPVAGAAVAGVLVAAQFLDHAPLAPGASVGALDGAFFLHAALLAGLASLSGIALMLGVARAQRLFDALPGPDWLALALGGALVGAVGAATPFALGAGHAALETTLSHPGASLAALAAIAGLKAAAVILSLGSGFRGGLFFASFFLGGLLGRAYALGAASLGFAIDPASAGWAIVAMAAFGSVVIGSPIAMTCFAFEMTGDARTTLAALIASLLAALIVRETFGYSFATWRFHLRGETIRGPRDVGWTRELKMARLMRRDMKTISLDRTIAAARLAAPIGATGDVFLLDAEGRYAGMVSTSELHTTSLAPDQQIGALARLADVTLTPMTTIRQALDLFERSESDRLGVVDDDGKLIGQVTEAHLLRRYGVELERRNDEAFRS